MSLINQVLRDLDKRRAIVPPAGPAAVKAAHTSGNPRAIPRARRWAIGLAITATAIVAGGLAQGQIKWPGQTVVPVASAVQVAVALPPALATTPPVIEPTRSPPPETMAETRPEAPAATARVAVAAPTARVARIDSAPTPRQAVRPATVSPATTSSENLVATPPPRIDIRMAAHTPRERAEVSYQHGVTAHQAGKIDESASAFMAALREDPGFAPARQAQAGLLIGQSRLDEAQALLQEGVALAPQQPMLALMLARLQAERLDLAAAAGTLKTALPNARQDAEYLGFYAAILQRAGRHTDANEQFTAALRVAPANSVWWMGLAISLAAEGQTGAAREAFMRAKTTGTLPPEAGQYVELRLRQML